MSLLAKRYAEALHALAKAQGATDAVAAGARAVHDSLATSAARDVLLSPDLTREQRGALLGKLTAGSHALLVNFVGVLQQRHRVEVLFDFYPALRDLIMAERGEVEGVVETPRALGEADMSTLGELAERLSGKKVSLTQRHRPEVLGGVRLRIGNVLYDGSMQASLAALEQKLLQASI